ncbi:MAG: MFS transporter, partial [Micrococcales bacterium]|nr:MFS transporter [Micrococcales bacterium]
MPTDTRFFGQPRALATIFGVEMWERFSFYGMQGILLIYLYYSAAQGGLGIDEGIATGIVGAYGGAVYLSTILGAWIADRILGSERVLFYSAVVIMLGHIALALLPGLLGVGVGLVLVAVGSGGLKANATSVVGTLYTTDDPRRDAGFSLFYLGINLGAFLGPLLTGLLQSTAGFHWGFGLAAVGMAIGLVQYTLGRKRIPAEASVVHNPLPRNRYALMIGVAVGAVIVVAILMFARVIRADNLADIVILVSLAATIAYFVVILSSRKVTALERSRVVAFIPLFIVSVGFWSLYQQQFTVMTVYSDKRLNRDLFGWEMPVPWVQSINPIFIIILSGVFAALWTKLGTRQPSTPVKFGLAAIIMGAAFLLFLPWAGGGENTTPLLAIVGILSFMMLPGRPEWFTEGGYSLGFYGPNTFAQLAMRTAFMFTMTAAVGGMVAAGLKDLEFKRWMVRRLAILGIVSAVVGMSLFPWYMDTLPEIAHLIMENRLPSYFVPAIMITLGVIVGYFLLTLIQ